TFGIEVVSVSLQRIWDTSSYIANLANKTLSRKRKEVEIEEARLRSRAERAESDAKRRQEVAESQANERILEVQQELEVFRRQCTAAINRARLESDSAIAEAESQGQRQVEEMKVELQQLKNRSEVTQLAEAQRRSAELVAAGEGEAVNLVKQTHNELLRQKVTLLNKSGDIGKLALFVNQMPALFSAYQTHAKNQRVNELLVLNEEDGFNSAVNRGPAALVNFLHQLEEGFGISIKQFMGSSNTVLVANGQGKNGQASTAKAQLVQKKEQ
ncbi:MAG: hypothetical protein KDE46_28895, partial [Caldilineaceae bacterium]|nr:hypothetical protein [Caldilineaceae bacterium]